MKIKIKVLKGQEHTLEVTGDTQVLEVKKQLEDLLCIPTSKQKLIFLGRPLTDEKFLNEYASLVEGAKVNLIVSNMELAPAEQQQQEVGMLRCAAYKFLRDFYPEAETLRIVDEFGKEFLRSVSTLNLDDYERIATSCLEEEALNG